MDVGCEVEELRGLVNELERRNQELLQVVNKLFTPSKIYRDNDIVFGIALYNNLGSITLREQLEERLRETMMEICSNYNRDGLNVKGYVKPQASSIVHPDSSDVVITNLSLYTVDFVVDKVGMPLSTGESATSRGWGLPAYSQSFRVPVQPGSLDDSDAQLQADSSKMNQSRRRCCFNCGDPDHNLNDCPAPKDQARINESRQQFARLFQSDMNNSYTTQDSRFKHIEAGGEISARLRAALGLSQHDLPPYLYRMRRLGYPPGYTKLHRLMKVKMFDGDGNEVGDATVEEGEVVEEETKTASEIILYPGFNCALPPGVVDRSAELGYPSRRMDKPPPAGGHFLHSTPLIQDQLHHRQRRCTSSLSGADGQQPITIDLCQESDDLEVVLVEDDDVDANASHTINGSCRSTGPDLLLDGPCRQGRGFWSGPALTLRFLPVFGLHPPPELMDVVDLPSLPHSPVGVSVSSVLLTEATYGAQESSGRLQQVLRIVDTFRDKYGKRHRAR